MPNYTLIDQTTENFPVKFRQFLICNEEAGSTSTYKRGFCAVPLWEDRSPEDSKADAELILRALSELGQLEAERAKNAELLAVMEDAYNEFRWRLIAYAQSLFGASYQEASDYADQVSVLARMKSAIEKSKGK